MGLKLSCNCMWVSRACTTWLADRGVIGSQRLSIFLLASIFFGIEKNILTAQSRIDTTIANNYPQVNQELPCWKNDEDGEEKKRDKTNIRVGTSVTVKVGDIDEKIRDGKSRRTRKELVGCLAHITYVLDLSQFWWLVPDFSMVYIWRTPVEVSSETPIHVLTILFHLCISPPYSWRLMMVWTILTSTLSAEMGSGILPSLSNKPYDFLPSWIRRVM